MEKILEELFQLMLEEEESKLKTQQIRVKMLKKLARDFPKIYREMIEPSVLESVH